MAKRAIWKCGDQKLARSSVQSAAVSVPSASQPIQALFSLNWMIIKSCLFVSLPKIHTFIAHRNLLTFTLRKKAPILIIETLRTQFYHRLFIYFHENLKLTQIPSLFQSFYIILIFVTIGCTIQTLHTKTQKIFFLNLH